MSTKLREHPRYAHVAHVVVYLGGQVCHGRTTNVSRGGLCVSVDTAIELGIDVDLDISLVFDDEAESEPLRLPARTAWCTAVDLGFQLGLSFRPLAATDSRYLQMFLKFLENESRSASSDTSEDIFGAAIARGKS